MRAEKDRDRNSRLQTGVSRMVPPQSGSADFRFSVTMPFSSTHQTSIGDLIIAAGSSEAETVPQKG